MRPRVTAPYYLAGDQRRRWHRNQGENGLVFAAGAAAASYALHKPKHQHVAIRVAASKGYNVHPTQARSFGKAVGVAAAGAGAYGAYHAGRSVYMSKKANQKRKKR